MEFYLVKDMVNSLDDSDILKKAINFTSICESNDVKKNSDIDM